MLHFLQTIGQRAFLTLEKGFNRVFGERLNPLYYLGAISYFLLWIAIATGLYLYAFFETGVAVAYASVEALTHDQWFAGGIVRSIHRYASDALVITMLLHLVRHITFDHHRGFRWFSWVSGVMLLWLTFASGVNGYMLVWDRLAQFVVTATTEWFDALPVIGGVMARNFITNANVSDRLFSLLSFLHIGLPLGLLAVLWVHTQRVPGAKTNPPRVVMAGVLAMLLLLSLAKPAVSQGPVDMATLPVTVDFDWFYLPVFALMERVGATNTWLLTVGGSLFLVALPWLPPLRRATHASWTLAAQPDERLVVGRSGETLLDAGLRAGLAMPFECRNGGCGACLATIVHGQVRLNPYQKSVLSDVQRAEGKTLLCCAEPLGDIEITYTPVLDLARLPVQLHHALVTRLERLSADVMRLCLALPGNEPLQFYAGQYINIVLDGGDKRSFSMATAPHVGGDIELHVRLVPGGKFTTAVFEHMQLGDRVNFEGPLGTFTLREDSQKPIIFVAGSTGFAPVKSMVESAFHVGITRQMILYWGVRRRQDLYLNDLAEQWAREHANFSYVPVLSLAQDTDAWLGRTGLVHEAILADFADLSRHQVYACGSVPMVQAAQPAFARQGIASDDCFSDAFHLAPQRPLDSPQADVVKLAGDHV